MGHCGAIGVDSESLSSGSRQRVWQWVGLWPVVRAEEEHNPTLTDVLTHELGAVLRKNMSYFD